MHNKIIRFLIPILILMLAGTVAAEEEVTYKDLEMLLMLPTLDISADIVFSPWDGENWDVYWLEDRAGLLEGSAFPGEGFTVLAGHNHLSSTEAGPFLFTKDMGINDVIFVSKDDELKRFRVYTNELLEANDGRKLAEIASAEPGTLVLLTCENETPEGIYANRRAIFAKPIDD